MIYTVTERMSHDNVYLIEAPSKATAKRIVLHQTIEQDKERIIDWYDYHGGRPQLDVDGAFLTKEDALLSIAPRAVDKAKARRVPKKTRGVSQKGVCDGGS